MIEMMRITLIAWILTAFAYFIVKVLLTGMSKAEIATHMVSNIYPKRIIITALIFALLLIISVILTVFCVGWVIEV